MSENPPRSKIRCMLPAWLAVLIIVPVLMAFPSAARAPGIQDIQPGDMVFIYEQNLDLTGLRTGGQVVTALRKYDQDNPTMALLREVPVQDDTSFTFIPAAFGDMLGIYYAFNATQGTMGSVYVNVPSVTVDAVLANPYHSDSIQGLSIPSDTAIAFKITSIDVGGSYHAGSLYPATVDLVLTTPGGAQLTTIQGRDFSAMNVSSQVFYTDDPGRPGAISLQGLGTGTFSVQAQWRDPESFHDQAPYSNVLTFSIGNTIGFSPTPTPVVTPVTTLTTVPTTAATTQVTTLPTPETTATLPATTSAPPTVPPGTPAPTGTPSPSPTPMPTQAFLAFLSPAMAALPRVVGRKGR